MDEIKERTHFTKYHDHKVTNVIMSDFIVDENYFHLESFVSFS